jgi:hypothetical protein
MRPIAALTVILVLVFARLAPRADAQVLYGSLTGNVTDVSGAAIAGGWQLNGILSRMSGTSFTVASAGTSLNAPGNSQRANQVDSNVQILGGHGPGAPYFDPTAFAPVTAVSFGTSGRNILLGPGILNMDASLFRDFRLTERFKLQFRAESFGLTNTPQFGNPAATVSSATFNADGTIKNLNGYTIISSSEWRPADPSRSEGFVLNGRFYA